VKLEDVKKKYLQILEQAGKCLLCFSNLIDMRRLRKILDMGGRDV